MKDIALSFQAELMKLKRSWIFLITLGLFIFIPIVMSLLMYISQHPEISAKLGLVGAKAQLFSENNWNGFFEIILQMIAILGVIAFGFVTSWVFGRESMEKTLTDILALPISRSAIVISKFMVVFIWCMVLSITMFMASLAVGSWIGMPGWTSELFLTFTSQFFIAAALTILLSTAVGFIASISKGIIAPIGFVLFVLMLSQFIVIGGLGAYFPWAIPGVFAVSGSVPGMELTLASYIILLITSIAGLFATLYWWRLADHA